MISRAASKISCVISSSRAAMKVFGSFKIFLALSVKILLYSIKGPYCGGSLKENKG